MKKLLNASLLLAVCGIALFLGCKKDTFKEDKANLEIENSVPVAEASVQGSLSVSDYGFLKFETYNQFEEYLNFLKTESHSKVKDVLQEVGFTCPGFNNYGVEYESENVTDEQLVNYIISEDSVVQIAGVIFRPVNNYAYLITMDPSELNLETYAMLQSGSFEIDRMNRFVINTDEDRGCFDFFGFLIENHSGHDEAVTELAIGGPGESEPPRLPNGKIDYPDGTAFGRDCEPHRVVVGHLDPVTPVYGTMEYCCNYFFGIRIGGCGWKK